MQIHVFTVTLYKIKCQLTFKLKNKLSAQCINWYQNKMKVKYATQTSNALVANALEYLKKENFEKFQNCEATVQFIRTIDWLFDFMNTKNPFGKGFKKPVTRNNLLELKSIVINKINYLFSLKIQDGNLISNTGQKTFVCGLAAKSILDVAEDIFREN